MTKQLTLQKVYAELRKAGHGAAKWEPSRMVRGWGDWSPGVRVTRGGGTLIVSYETGHRGTNGQSANAMEHYVAPALQAAGIEGQLSDDKLTFTIGL